MRRARRRLCCRRRRVEGGADFTDTTVFALPLRVGRRAPHQTIYDADDRMVAAGMTAAAAAWLVDVTGDTPGVGVSGDQLDGFPPGTLEAALARLAGEPVAERGSASRLPVPRRPWRRVLCWVALGHHWFPDVPACLECGAARVRAAWRGDR